MSVSPRIAILTLCVGEEYARFMAPGLQSKDRYAERWGYTHIVGGPAFHDSTRPPAWSKIGFWFSHLDLLDYDFLWLSDADSIITNPSICLGDIVKEVFWWPRTQGAWWIDSACNKNSGQMLVRSRSKVVRRWIAEADACRDLIDHPWWENAALIRVWENDPEIKCKVTLRTDWKRINAYLGDSPVDHWTPDCFVLHYAGMHQNPEWVHNHMKSVARPDLAN